jgi:hypothetical protein
MELMLSVLRRAERAEHPRKDLASSIKIVASASRKVLSRVDSRFLYRHEIPDLFCLASLSGRCQHQLSENNERDLVIRNDQQVSFFRCQSEFRVQELEMQIARTSPHAIMS